MMPDNIPQKTWKKADEFFDALANGTTDAQQLAAKDAEIAKLQEIVRTQAEEAAKATYYYKDKMDELKKECDALAGLLKATIEEVWGDWHSHMAREQFEQHFSDVFAALAQHKGKNDDW